MPDPNPDDLTVQEAQAALNALEEAFWAAKPGEKFVLRPQLETAYAQFARAKTKLLQSSTVTKAADVEKMKAIRKDLENAADQQALILAAVRLVAFLAAI